MSLAYASCSDWALAYASCSDWALICHSLTLRALIFHMSRHHLQIAFLVTAILIAAGAGCASMRGGGNDSLLPSSNIDPTGERLFSGSPFGLGTGDGCRWFKCPTSDKSSPATTPETTPSAATTALPPSALPGNLGDTRTTMTSTATSPTGFPASGISTAIVMEPDRERAPFHGAGGSGGVARPTSPIEGPAVVATPNEQIAPLGSEVIIVASYLGTGDNLITNEPIEWAIDGVGHIIAFDTGSVCDPLHADLRKAKKGTEKSALTKTSAVYQFLTRGTPETSDDIQILRGQTWVSINSTREGTSNVTVTGTTMKDWSRRSDRAIIHWVDAEWELPRTTIAAVGSSRILTTTVRRKTDGSPRANWVVRYEIIGGPAATLDGNAQVQEVVTNSQGQATVELKQTEMKQGTSTVAVSIIRPAGIDDGEKRITVGRETIRQTWASGGVLTIQTQGPRQIKLGEEANYTLTITNATGVATPARVWLPLSPVVQFVRSTPQPVSLGELVQWELAAIPPQQSVMIPLTLKFAAQGDANVEAFVAPLTVPTSVVPPSPNGSPSSIVPTIPSTGITPAPTSPSSPSSPVSRGPATTYTPTTPLPAKELEYRWERTDEPGNAVNTPIRVGDTVIYSLIVKNTSPQTHNNVQLRVLPPQNAAALEPIEATNGTERLGDGTLVRVLESLLPNATRQLQVRYVAREASARQTLRAEIFIGNRSIATPETTLSIGR
ncbi:MAG: hypothetical protein ACRC46_08705 [Thermoguttaceae bacterium]